MKKFYPVVIAALLALICSCDKDEPGGGIPEKKDIVLTRSEAEVVQAGEDFSFDLFREVAATTGCRDMFISPFSAHIANCLLANGASGETYSQIVKTLGFDGLDINDVNSAYNKIVTGLREVDTSTKLEIANALWIDDGFPVSQSFADALAESYEAYVKNLDFSSPKALKTINGWCSEKTHNLIPEFLDQLSPEHVLILMNALYFNGKWKDKFESSMTSKGEFKSLGSGTVSKDFMHLSHSFQYSETNDGKIRMCELPYGNGAFVMDVILPDKDVDFKGFIEGMTADKWNGMFTYSGSHLVNLSLPKFKMEKEYDLTEALVSIGMELPYDQNKADLKKMCSDPAWQLWVDKTIQKTVIKVDEDGSEAAAVTAHVIKGDTAAAPQKVVEFNCDHPFMFMIRETTSGVILFMGTFTE